MPSSSDDDAFIDTALQDFSWQLQSAFPLRHFGEFYDEEQLKEKTLQLQENVSKTLFSKVWNRDREEVFSLLKKLRERMNKKVIAEWKAQNKKHKMESVSFFQRRAEMLSEDFQNALEDQLLLNPDMNMESFQNFVDVQKVFHTHYFDGIWNPWNSQIKGERKVKMVRNLDAIVVELVDKHKLFLGRKLVDEGEKPVEEVKAIIMEKSRQLKSYVNSHPNRVSKCHLKAKVEDIQSYLLNGKGSTLRESQKEIYLKVVQTLEDGIKFLTENGAEEDANEDLTQWVEQFVLKLQSYCCNDEGVRDESQGIQREREVNGMDGCDSSDRSSSGKMQQILQEDPVGYWKEEELKPESRTHKGCSSNNLTGSNDGVEVEEICIVDRSRSKANDGLGPASAPTPTAKKRIRPLILSVTGKDGNHSHSAANDPLAKKRRTGGNTSNVSRKTITKASSLHRRTSKVNENTNESAQAKPSRRSTRLKNKFNSPDRTMGITGKTGSAFNKFSSSSLHGEMSNREYKSTVTDTVRFTCEKCNKSFCHRSSLNRHVLNHEGKLPFGCSHCDQRCHTMPDLLAHILTHSDERPYSCVTCNKQFCTKYKLTRHIQDIHRLQKEDAEKLAKDAGLEYLRKVTNNPNYDGDISSTVVMSHAVKKANNLGIPHLTDSLSSTKAMPSNSNGPKRFTRFEQISILEVDPPKYKCDVCRNEIKRKCHLKYHGKNCNKNGYKCDHCGKQFFSITNLVIHQRIHTGEKPFKCPTCNKQFAHKSNLEAHVHIHTGKSRFPCQLCERKFKHRLTLSRHLLKHEGKLPLGCGYCDLRFASMAQLKEHVIIHSNDERPYRCPACERTFYRKTKLAQHIHSNHHHSKEDAMKLADEAAAAYLKAVTKNPKYDGDISHPTVLSHFIKKAKLTVSGGTAK